MTPPDQSFSEGQARRNDFPTTHWSIVIAAADTSALGSPEALEQLCRAYWHPVYFFVRHQGHGPEDALDLTQAFFARFLEKEQIKRVDPNRGRLRSFLLSSLKNFLVNKWAHQQAKKRGGGSLLFSLDQKNEAETHFLAEPTDPAAAPDQAFEKKWVLTLLDQVLARLRDESVATGEQEHFDALKVFVWGNQTVGSQTEIAAKLGMTPNALGVAVHRLRRRYGQLLRKAIARTVVGENEIEVELRYLIMVVSS